MPAGEKEHGRTGNGQAKPNGLLAAPSDDAVSAADEVVITEHKLRKRRYEKELAEVEDFFTERQQAEAARLAEEQEREAACVREQQREREVGRAAEERRRWFDGWQAYTLNSLPRDARTATANDAYDAVAAVLEKLLPSQPVHVIQPLVDSAIARVLAPWNRRQQIAQAVADAVNRLPAPARNYFGEPTEWQLRATKEAREAVGQLAADATLPEIQAAVRKAVESIAAEFQEQTTCQEVIKNTGWQLLWVLGDDARKKAIEAVRQAVEALPPGTDRAAMEKVRDAVIERVKQEDERRKKKEQATATALAQVYPYLEKLLAQDRFELENGKTLWDVAEGMKQRFRGKLENELAGTETTEEAAKLVRQMARQQLGLEPRKVKVVVRRRSA